MVLEDFILHFTRCAETRHTAVGDHVVGTEHLDGAVDDLLPDSAPERLRACNLVGRRSRHIKRSRSHWAEHLQWEQKLATSFGPIFWSRIAQYLKPGSEYPCAPGL